MMTISHAEAVRLAQDAVPAGVTVSGDPWDARVDERRFVLAYGHEVNGRIQAPDDDRALVVDRTTGEVTFAAANPVAPFWLDMEPVADDPRDLPETLASSDD